MSATTVWVATVMSHNDDYKRAESHEAHMSVHATERAAALTAVGFAYDRNRHWDGRGGPRRAAYRAAVHSALQVDFADQAAADEFAVRHDEAIEAFLGEPEFTLRSGGYRPEWSRREMPAAEEVDAEFRLLAGVDALGGMSAEERADDAADRAAARAEAPKRQCVDLVSSEEEDEESSAA